MTDDFRDDDFPAIYPAYLRDASAVGKTYGTLSYNRRAKCWTIKGEPCVTELAKRLFPGCDGRGRGSSPRRVRPSRRRAPLPPS